MSFLNLMRNRLKPKAVNDALTNVVQKAPPDFSSADAGKVLAVDSNGELEWKDGGTYTPPAYSTTEVNTGQKWIDNKDIYKKTINLGALPNNTLINYPHGIENIGKIIFFEGVANDSFNNVLPLPYVNADSASNQTQIQINQTNILIKASTDLSSYSAYVTLYYTKTTTSKRVTKK